MAAHARFAHQFARQLFKLSLDKGTLSAERVTGVLAWVEKHRPANPVMILREYHRLVAAEVARGQARIEHAGPISNSVRDGIAAAMSRKYGRAIAASALSQPSLIAGLRVRVGDDVYESSVAGQLAALANSV